MTRFSILSLFWTDDSSSWVGLKFEYKRSFFRHLHRLRLLLSYWCDGISQHEYSDEQFLPKYESVRIYVHIDLFPSHLQYVYYVIECFTRCLGRISALDNNNSAFVANMHGRTCTYVDITV